MAEGAPLVKICGVCRPSDAEQAVAAGATHIGVIRIGGTARWRSEVEVLAVIDAAAGAKRVGVFLNADPASVLVEAALLGLDAVQLHGAESPELVSRLQDAGLEVWKVVKPATLDELARAAERYRAADLLLLEGRSDRGAGGVGARLDWDVLEPALRRSSGHRFGVAGGLTPANVAEAVRRLRPALVDVSSGVESSPGTKDPAKVRRFVQAARGAPVE